EDVGFEVLSAPDGPTGIETAQVAQPAVILLDMMMPGLDGIVTCERLKEDPVLADIPVVGVTSSADLGYTEKAFAAGAQFFLTKPFGAGSLVQVVELALKSTQADTATRRHQHHPRFPAELPVWCLAGAEADTARGVMGYTKNLSLGGILLLLPEKLEPGTVLRLCLGLPEGPTTADGTVMWQTSFSTAEGGILHGIRLLRFAEAGGLVQYRSFLSQIAAHQAARTEA
ncbi:MAG: two-component system response regulator, partial [Candidatus Methylomirabilales bacterium]